MISAKRSQKGVCRTEEESSGRYLRILKNMKRGRRNVRSRFKSSERTYTDFRTKSHYTRFAKKSTFKNTSSQ